MKKVQRVLTLVGKVELSFSIFTSNFATTDTTVFTPSFHHVESHARLLAPCNYGASRGPCGTETHNTSTSLYQRFLFCIKLHFSQLLGVCGVCVCVCVCVLVTRLVGLNQIEKQNVLIRPEVFENIPLS